MTKGIYFKLSPEEREIIQEKMKLAGICNQSAYIRKMCLNGMVVKLELPELDICSKSLSALSRNVNQIAKCANAGGQTYTEDLIYIKQELNTIQGQFAQLLEQLAAIG